MKESKSYDEDPTFIHTGVFFSNATLEQIRKLYGIKNTYKNKHNHCKYTMINFIVILFFISITVGLMNSKINCV